MSTAAQQKSTGSLSQELIKNWFTSAHSSLSVDQLTLETNVISNSKGEFYRKAILGDEDGVMEILHNVSLNHFKMKLFQDFAQEIFTIKDHIVRVFFSVSSYNIRSWIVVKENDEDTMKTIVLMDERVSNKFGQHGITLTCTIVEESDFSKTPSGYFEVPLNG